MGNLERTVLNIALGVIGEEVPEVLCVEETAPRKHVISKIENSDGITNI